MFATSNITPPSTRSKIITVSLSPKMFLKDHKIFPFLKLKSDKDNKPIEQQPKNDLKD